MILDPRATFTVAAGPMSSHWRVRLASKRIFPHGDGQAPLPACTVHLESAPRLGLDKGFDARILPSQEHLFRALVR